VTDHNVVRNLNIASLKQGWFSIALATAHLLLCVVTHEMWVFVAIPSSFWFFLILPVLLFFNLVSFVYLSIKNRRINRDVLIYFILSLAGMGIFSFAIVRGCFISV